MPEEYGVQDSGYREFRRRRPSPFIDNGLGMTADEVEEYINQIAFSGAPGFPGEI